MLSFNRRQLRPAARNRAAFTLIEVMIAMIVFVSLVMVFSGTIPLARKTASANGQYAQAISLCQHKIDQLRAVGYGRLTYTELLDAGIIDTYPKTTPFSFVTTDDVATVLVQPTATVTLESAGTDMTKATITITWKNTTYSSKTNTMTLVAIIANVS